MILYNKTKIPIDVMISTSKIKLLLQNQQHHFLGAKLPGKQYK